MKNLRIFLTAGLVATASFSWAIFDPLGDGAAAKGMGGAYVAVAEDGTAAYWNPAGLAYVKSPEVNFSLEDLYGFGLVRYGAFGYTHPKIAKGTLSVNLLHLDTTGDANFFNYAESTYMVSYGRAYCGGCVAAGVGMRYYNAQTEGARGSGVGFDTGFQWRPLGNKFRLAAMAQDLNRPKIHWDTQAVDRLPYTLRLGALWRPLSSADLSTEWDKHYADPAQWHFGAAQRLFQGVLTVRAGIHRGGDQPEWGFALGGGVRLKGVTVDYGWDNQDSLGNTQTLSLRVQFGS